MSCVRDKKNLAKDCFPGFRRSLATKETSNFSQLIVAAVIINTAEILYIGYTKAHVLYMGFPSLQKQQAPPPLVLNEHYDSRDSETAKTEAPCAAEVVP